MRILVMGAGSMGSIIGALMTKRGLDVTLCDRNEAHVKAMNSRGLRIEGYLNETIAVKAVLPSELRGIFDIVILLTKATANESALTTIKSHLGDDGCVLTLQNGINEDVVASFVGRRKTCGGIILWGGDTQRARCKRTHICTGANGDSHWRIRWSNHGTNQ